MFLPNVIRGLVLGCIVCTAVLHAEQSASVIERPIAQKVKHRVYVDMVGDLFHIGHINAIKNAIKKACEVFTCSEQDICLIVGVCGDEECTSYKRKPILTTEERCAAIGACRYVDEVVPNAPVAVTAKFLDEQHIDMVAHGDDFDQEKMRKYYGAAIDRGILLVVPYTQGISTSDIIRRILSRAEELSAAKK